MQCQLVKAPKLQLLPVDITSRRSLSNVSVEIEDSETSTDPDSSSDEEYEPSSTMTSGSEFDDRLVWISLPFQNLLPLIC